MKIKTLNDIWRLLDNIRHNQQITQPQTAEQKLNTLLLGAYKRGDMSLQLLLEYLAITQGDVAACLQENL